MLSHFFRLDDDAFLTGEHRVQAQHAVFHIGSDQSEGQHRPVATSEY
jgi:hypothetical protein